MTRRQWYRFHNQAADAAVADLYVFGEIGSFWDDDAVTAAAFVADLNALPAAITTIRLHVNSAGGNVFDAITIANALRAQREEHGRVVDVRIEGLAASSATIVTSAGQPIRMAGNATMMIHRPHALTVGEADAHRQMAEALDKIEGSIIATYRWVSPKSETELAAMMKATTWMNAEEALEHGFVTEIAEAAQAAAVFNPREIKALGPVPLRVAATLGRWIRRPDPAPVAASAVDVLRLCREGNCLDVAEGLITARATLADVTARVTQETQARAAELARVDEITAVCTLANLSRLAPGYIAGRMSAADVRAHVTTITALIDLAGGEIDGHLDPDAGARGPREQPAVDVFGAYNTMNRRGAGR